MKNPREDYSTQRAILKSDLSPTTKHVLLTLSHHVDVAGSAPPSVEQLAKDTGLSKRTVIRHLKIASRAGWVKVTRNEYSPQIPEEFKIKGEKQ
jgi:DNA-binding MarR family transcriptional regulator